MTKREKKHIEHADERKIKVINFISFLFGFAGALLLYVISDYFKQAIGSDNVSVFYFIAYIISLIGTLNLHKLVNKFGRSTVFFVFFFIQICFIAFLTFVQPSLMGIVLLMLYIISTNLAWVTLDMILESYSEDRKSGRIRGLHLTIMNVGILLGPFLSTRLLSSFNFYGLFIAAMAIYMAIFIFALFGLRGINYKFEKKLTISDLAKKILINRNIMKIYSIAFILDFFYALMIVYTPLYLLERGLSWNQIGIIFTIMLVPFIILQYPAGILADKMIGEKEMLIGALFIMGISTGSLFFITSTSVLVWGCILFITRIGASIIEILRDSYFYKKIDSRDVDIISFFRTASPIGFILATAISALLLVIFPLKYIFLLVAAIVLAGLYPALKLVDNKCEKDLEP
jgi:MFS family permease